MPNRYFITETNGALRIERHWKDDPGRPARPPTGGGGSRAGEPGPSTAGRVSTQWSTRSRRHMRWEYSALPWGMLGERPVMITLTYPGEWELWVPDARTFVKHREALKERWRRKFGAPIGVWVVEFQKRGAPHLHVYVGLPDAVSAEEYRRLQERTMRRRQRERELGRFEARRRTRAPSGEFAQWLRKAWWEVVGSELSAHHGRGVDVATAFYSVHAAQSVNRARVAEYFWRESGKWAQKQAPEGFGSLKFYGRWGGKQGFEPVTSSTELSEGAFYELRRLLRTRERKKRQALATTLGRSLRPIRRRGRDGMTAFDVPDAMALGPTLVEWAEITAAAKAAEREGRSDVVWFHAGASIRALSERRAPRFVGPTQADFDAWEAKQASWEPTPFELEQEALRQQVEEWHLDQLRAHLERAGIAPEDWEPPSWRQVDGVWWRGDEPVDWLTPREEAELERMLELAEEADAAEQAHADLLSRLPEAPDDIEPDYSARPEEHPDWERFEADRAWVKHLEAEAELLLEGAEETARRKQRADLERLREQAREEERRRQGAMKAGRGGGGGRR